MSFVFPFFVFFFFKQKTAYEMRISDWSSDVCSSDLLYTWRKQLLRGAMAGFVPVELTPAEPLTTPSDPGRIEIRRSGGFTVSIDGLVDKEALRLALEVIGELER